MAERKRRTVGEVNALLRKFCQERGIEFLGDNPDHPIFKRGYTVAARRRETSSGSGEESTDRDE